jgi:hypothetical protein
MSVRPTHERCRPAPAAARPLALVAAALLLAGCASTLAGPVGAPGPTPATLAAGDADNGHKLDARVGDHVAVTLNSTYWTINESSNPAVLRLAGHPVVSPQIGGCVPGGGCGTVQAAFDALAPGTADVTATRTSCGEALRCTGGAGAYRLTVAVT